MSEQRWGVYAVKANAAWDGLCCWLSDLDEAQRIVNGVNREHGQRICEVRPIVPTNERVPREKAQAR